MNSGFIKTAAFSPKVAVGNVRHNCDEIIKMLEEAKNQNVQVAVFPELSLCGSTCGDLFFQRRLIDACLEGIEKIKNYSENFDGIIVIGAPLKADGKLFNCAVVLQSGVIQGIVPKTHLTVSERRWFTSGKNADLGMIKILDEYVSFGKIIFQINDDARFGIEIGEDLLSAHSPSEFGANIILNLSAQSEAITKNDYIRSLIKVESAKCTCGYVYASAGFGESTTDYVFSGYCAIAENGAMLAESERFSLNGSYTIYDIDVDKLNADREKNREAFESRDYIFNECNNIPFLNENDITRKFDAHPFIPENEDEMKKRCEEILSIQCAGLAKRMIHIGIKKLVIGISGGLDSTLALLVAERTMKMLKYPVSDIMCITMPGFGTTDLTYTNACGLVKSLGATLSEISIKDACIQHMNDIGHDINVHDVTYENTQARERTQILMDIANKNGALLVGTGDLSELALGWCTYNGDHMSMYGVNASVPKTLMQYLVRFVADNSDENTAKILYSVLDTPISPELLPPDENGKMEQKTENALGPYEVHDFYIYHFLRFGTDPEKLLFMAKRAFKGKYTENELENWLRIFIKRFFQSQFKRSCLPDGPAVGSVSLSPRGSFIMPSDACYDEWLKF